MKIRAGLVLCGMGLLGVGSAMADTTEIFGVSGNFDEFTDACPNGCVTGSISGTELIDMTAGTITGSALSVSLDGKQYAFSGAPVSQGAQGNSASPDDPDQTPLAYQAIFQDGGTELDLNLSIDGSLAGLSGDVCSFIYGSCGAGNSSYFSFLETSSATTFVNVGQLTPEGIVTSPEPASLVLLGSGVVGAAGAMRRRLRRE